MITKVKSSGYFGIESFSVDVEVDISKGLPAFNIVGLGDTAINESRERIKAGIRNSGYKLEPRRITVNLTPANMKKVGTHFDLPTAVGIMEGYGLIKSRKEILENYIFMGEVSLAGEVKRTQGIVNGAILAKENNCRGIVIPYDNLREGSLIKGIEIVAVKNLKEAVEFLENGNYKKYDVPKEKEIFNEEIDFYDVKGQEKAKRALEICAAGGHNLLMVGTPGSGKTMLAKRITTILPPMTDEEKIEVTKLYSISGELSETKPIIDKRPFRSPHHTSSSTAVIGGGKTPSLGEISLADKGVLFLDEIVEFKKDVLEALREPLEERKVSVTRAVYKAEFPADFIFIGVCNPCKCGYAFEDGDLCTCSAGEISRYMKKLSGPILDRIDLKIEIKRLTEDELTGDTLRETSEEIRKRVIRAREIQKKRFGCEKLNGHMTRKDLEKFCRLDEETKVIMKTAVKNLNLSARSFDRVLKAARTISDLAGSRDIKKVHIMEALSYRISEFNI